MSELKIELSKEAADDIDAIWDYTAEIWSVAQAEAYTNSIRKTIQTIALMPQIGREYREIAPPIRIHPSGRHYVIYRVKGGILNIVRVLHQRRNWFAILDS